MILYNKIFFTTLEKRYLYIVLSNTDKNLDKYKSYKVNTKRLVKYMKKNFPMIFKIIDKPGKISNKKVHCYIAKKVIKKLRSVNTTIIIENPNES